MVVVNQGIGKGEKELKLITLVLKYYYYFFFKVGNESGNDFLWSWQSGHWGRE